MMNSFTTDAEFLENVLPKENSLYTKGTVFNALFSKIGTNILASERPLVPYIEETAKLNAKRKELFIRAFGANKQRFDKPRTSDYIEVAMGGYIAAGGHLSDFYKDLDIYKNKFERENDNPGNLAKQLVQSRYQEVQKQAYYM